MNKSTNKVEIVKIKLDKHSNADSLSLVKVFDYQVVVRTQDWEGVTLAAYIVPDTMVQNKEPFKFLFKPEDHPDKWYRVTVKRFRGEMSMGLLIPAPKGSKEGDDIAEMLGVKRYEPEVKEEVLDERKMTLKQKFTKKVLFKGIGLLKRMNLPHEWAYELLKKFHFIGSIPVQPPEIRVPEYDVDSMYRYSNCFVPGEMVVVTEKIHGMNARYVWSKGKLHCGGHYTWRAKSDSDVYWKTISKYPKLIEWMKKNPDTVIYGEVFGSKVQEMEYGCAPGETKLAVFDVYKDGKYVGYADALNMLAETDVLWVPCATCVTVTPFDLEALKKLAERDSSWYKGFSEGIVVKPSTERYDRRIGRVQLKLVSNRYLESK